MIIDERLPGHTKVISKEGLNMNTFPTLKELWENADDQEKKKKKI